MAEWVSIQNGGFVAADVIRWKETIYKPRQTRKTKAARLGEYLVTAEVLKEPDAAGWVRLLVRKCEILSNLSIKKIPAIASDAATAAARCSIRRAT